MKIFRNDENGLVFDTESNESWVRFERTADGMLEIDSSDSPTLDIWDIKTLRKWLKKAFRK